MASENETVAEIVKEMRENANVWRKVNWNAAPEMEQHYSEDDIDDLADRIESAHRRESNLRRRLKVAEDALEYAKGSITRDCTNDCDHLQECGDFKVCLCEQRINNALAEIRELESVKTKPIRNCDRFETAEDAYNACPQFCDIDVKTMTERELKIVEATTKCLEWLFAPIAEKGGVK